MYIQKESETERSKTCFETNHQLRFVSLPAQFHRIIFSYLSSLQIVGADSCQTQEPEEQVERLVNHIAAVRSLRGLSLAKIVFCPESNLAWEGKRIAGDLARKRIPNVFVLKEDKNRVGVRTTDVLKKEMVVSFNRLLIENRVRFHPRMICTSITEQENLTPDKMRDMLIKQLGQYTRELRINKKDPSKPPTEVFSGKMAGPDDHCIALQLSYKAVEFWFANINHYRHAAPLWEAAPALTGRVN